MCNTTGSVHRSSFQGIVDPFSFSTFHLLKTCNRILLPSDLRNYYHQISKDDNNNNSSNKTLVSDQDDSLLKQSNRNSEIHSPPIELMFPNNNKNLSINLPTLPPITNILPTAAPPIDYHLTDFPLTHRIGNDFGGYNNSILSKRQRGEKRPIPAEQKDEKYFERRKRNNEAAKKSRDARKMREDRIAFRAAILEQENAILRAQLIAVREENAILRSQK